MKKNSFHGSAMQRMFFILCLLAFTSNLRAQTPTLPSGVRATTGKAMYVYRIRNNNNNSYYFVADNNDGANNFGYNGDGVKRLKTSNQDGLRNSNDAYWFLLQDGTSGYKIGQATSGLYVNHPTMNTGENVNSSNNDPLRHRIILSSSPSTLRFDNNGHILHISRNDFEIEPDAGNGNWLNFWNDMNGNIAKWTFVDETEIPNQTQMTAPVVTMSGLAGTVGNYYGVQMSHTNAVLQAPYYPSFTPFNGSLTYYWTSTGLTTTQPTGTPTVTYTYTWSIAQGSSIASINSDGVLQINVSITSEQQIVVRLNTKCNMFGTEVYNVDVDYAITVTHQDAIDERDYDGFDITPSSATLEPGSSLVFEAPSTMNMSSRTCDAYETLLGEDDAAMYRVNYAYTTTKPTEVSTPSTPIDIVSWGWELEGTDCYTYANISHDAGEATVTPNNLSDRLRTIYVKATGYGNGSGIEAISRATITVPRTELDITNMYSPGTYNMGVGSSEDIRNFFVVQASNGAAPYEEYVFTANNTSVATIDDEGIITAVGIGSASFLVQSKKINGENGLNCTVSVNVTLAAPTITIVGDDVVITDNNLPNPDIHVYYTIDGNDPTNASTLYVAPFIPTDLEVTVKAITYMGDNHTNVVQASYFKTGVSDNKVVLNDLEDHRWSYYQTARPDEQYPQVLTSPDPRNVKIIYRGGGVTNGSAVAISADAGEGQNEIVYYKTIEKVEGGRWLTGNYPYKVIPNPFSKRPAVTNGGNKTYYGFSGWKIVSGGTYIDGKNNNNVLELEEVIHFVNLPYSDTNCISATIELEATWTQASVAVNGTSGLSGSNYETNFIIYNSTGNVTVDGTVPATVSNRYPDGTPAGGSPVVNSFTSNADLKLEYIKIGDGVTPVHPITPTTASSTSAGSGTFYIGSGWLIVGRGCTGTVNYLRPVNDGNKKQIKMRLESGKYTKIEMMRNKDYGNTDNDAWGRFVYGCDYDRAKDDGVSNNGTGDNTKLRVVTIVALSTNGAAPGNDNTSDYLDVTIKSGYYGYSANYALYSNNIGTYTNMDGYGVCTGGNTDNSINNSYTTVDINGNSITYNRMSENASDNTFFKMHSFYCGRTRGGGKGGVNHIWIEGGEFNSFNCGGSTIPENTIKTHLRIKGGWFKGAVYGTSSTSVITGSEKMVITGGEINGWVSGGCNGTDFNDKGTLTGTTYVYVGGNAQLRAHQYDAAGNPVYNNAWGLVFGMEGGIIFGSGRGLPPVEERDCKYSGSATNSYIVVADNSFVEQNIYGGGCNGIAQNSHIYLMGGVVGGKVFGGTMKAISTDDTWRSRTSDIRMYGGWVKEGIYGGHDETGIQYDNASVKIYGGKVGSDIDHLANIHGGGYGNNTFTRGSVDVTIGKQNATDGATIFGDVYGGSAMGKVNGESNRTNDAVTNVTLNAGTINGALYGGGLGTSTYAADVYGPVQVKVYGGSVKTTDGTGNNGSGGVYGCNNTNGEPKSTVNVDIYHTDPAPSADEYALHAVYGGGNKAHYAQGTPHVTVHRCDNSIEYVYGGGNAADITNGNTDVTIYGGDVIGNVFGGGNGSAPGTEANVSGGTNVKIYGGTILNVFGGSNTSGTIGGNINVLAESRTESGESNCPMDVKSLFAGGNLAACNGGTVTVNCGAKVDDVYGGANMADINNNIHLVINGGNIHRVFGGNNASGAITGTITVDINVAGGCGDTIGYVYGGGNQAPYTAPDSDKNCPKVNVIKGHVLHDVYGGGLGLKTDATKGTITGNPQVKIYKGQVRIDGNVFGGGNAGKVFGNTNVQVGVTE